MPGLPQLSQVATTFLQVVPAMVFSKRQTAEQAGLQLILTLPIHTFPSLWFRYKIIRGNVEGCICIRQ